MDTPDRQLRCFVCIARLGSISKAAEVLDQTQSNLSKQLAALEATIGQPLFIRTGRGVELTKVGNALYETACAAYQDIDRVFEGIRQQDPNQGTVRLAAVHTISYYFTADLVSSFVATRQHANLSLMARSSPEVVALVESGKADLGFVYDSAVDSGSVATTTLFDDDMALVVRRDSALRGPQDLTTIPLKLVCFPPHYVLRRMLHSAGLQPEVAAEAETVDTMLRLTSSGVGACILPARMPEKVLSDYDLVRLPIIKPLLRRRVVAITQANKVPAPLRDDLLKHAEKYAATLRGDHQ